MGGLDSIDLAQERGRWEVVLKMVINHKMQGISCLTEEPLACQERVR
jgi:hypothetical protein